MRNQHDQFLYHIYPLGLVGAEHHNAYAAPQPRLDQLHPWIEHMRDLGVTTLYLGPVFESQSHGYDTSDFYHVDQRLGDDATLARFVAACHKHGIRVLLDGVFHHVGRDFWAFRDLQIHGEHSAYRDWFTNVRFGESSPYGDRFRYDGWNGHYNLVKLNLDHADVRRHLLDAVTHWVNAYHIDGLRLDAADYIDRSFLHVLSQHCRSLGADFWLLGEVIHGDYRQWANPELFHSVTNYEAYKGLYSSHNDANYFEIAHTLNRQFGAGGMYAGLPLYTFADNHDVERIASTLQNQAHLYPLHALLFTMPGAPSIYYGSEWGIAGRKHGGDDWPLRPQLALGAMDAHAPHRELYKAIRRFAQLRKASVALRRGSYQQLHVAPQQLVFARAAEGEQIIVAVNAAPEVTSVELNIPNTRQLVDILNEAETFEVAQNHAKLSIPPTWARVLRAVR